MVNCKNCNSEIAESYCPKCGQAAKLKRIDNHYISHEVLHLLHFEKGFFYSAKELMTRPGDSIREFIADNRTKHMKPVAYLILTSLLFTIIAHYFHADKLYNEKENLSFGKSHVASLMQWVQTHYGYANIMMGAFITVCVKTLFRKYPYNFFEITVLLCFVMGQGMLLLTVETLFIPIIGAKLYTILLTTISIAYPTWAIGQFYDRGKAISYIKAFVAYIAGYLLFYTAIGITGVLADILLKSTGTH